MAKIFIQQLWKLKIDWDQELPLELKDKWLKFREGLIHLNNLKVGRHALVDPIAENIQIHAFADASEMAYGAVIYLRSTSTTGETKVKILCAKSRVAPIKVITIPRLELCAAKLAVQRVQRVLRTINIKISKVTYWSDSQIVLSWIHGDPARLKPYVGSRIQKIREESSPSQWNYINTKQNPADLLSRGMTPHALVSSELWFLGPSFLQHPEETWPNTEFQIARLPAEERAVKIVLNCTEDTADNHFINRINHSNSFKRLQRVVAFLLRSIKLMKKSVQKTQLNEFLTVTELDEALKVIVKYVQGSRFQQEMKDLVKQGAVKSRSQLKALAPFTDRQGLLRVGGRLEAANISYNSKHSMLLPGNHTISKLIMNHLHITYLHPGPQALLAISHQQFWITQGRNLVRTVVNNCIQCTRAKP